MTDYQWRIVKTFIFIALDFFLNDGSLSRYKKALDLKSELEKEKE